MSLYQHHAPQSYGHPYPPQATHSFMQQHVQPSVPPYAYSSYSMPPYEPGNFRRDYATRLSELTMNSKPIIQNLSMMAQNFTRFSDIVAECLQAHIRRVPAWMKLPAFYVLDAISKNVYEPYAAKFSAFVVPLFLETYGQVDPQTRSKMAEMLVTWRTGSPSGKELFGVAAQVSLERQIWGNDPPTIAEPSTRRHGQAAPLTKSQVLAELDVTLALKEQATHANPYDTAIANQVNVLHQLRRMVELGVSQEELQQILSQLRAMGRDNSAVPPPPPPQFVAPPPSVYNGPPIIPPLAQYVQTPAPLVPPSTYPAPESQQPNISTTPVPSAVPNISGITSLFDSLVKAGLVSSSNTPLGAGTSTQTPPPASETLDEDKAKVQKKAEDERLEAQRKYTQEILGMSIRLTTADITRQRPKNVSTLYERLSIQCKQCASRFSDDSAGKKNLQDHLDMHFRHNRRMKEASGRGFSRSWFISVDDWISEPLTDVKGKGRELVLVGKNTDATKEAAAKRDAEVRASVVVVPPGDEAKSISCPVCKEVLRSEFREEDEEWIWRNAVRVKDKIFHATCQAEMATSTTLAAKLRADESAAAATATARSRSRTPERTAPSTPTQAAQKAKLNLLSLDRTLVADASSVAGIKRKARGDSQDTGSAETLVGTPPTKKVVLSAA